MAETESTLALLAAVRNYLDITYPDNELDQKLVRLLKTGQAEIDQWTGAEQNYLIEGQAQSLLFDHVRYARSGASEMFEENYGSKIRSLRIKSEVAAYEAENQED